MCDFCCHLFVSRLCVVLYHSYFSPARLSFCMAAYLPASSLFRQGCVRVCVCVERSALPCVLSLSRCDLSSQRVCFHFPRPSEMIILFHTTSDETLSSLPSSSSVLTLHPKYWSVGLTDNSSDYPPSLSLLQRGIILYD